MLHGKYSIFSLPDVPWNRFWPLRRAPGRSWARSLAFLGAFVDSLRALGTHRGLPETLPRRSRDPFGTLLEVPGRPESVSGTMWIAFKWHCLALAGSIWVPTTAPTTATAKRLAKKKRLAYRRNEHRSCCFVVLLCFPHASNLVYIYIYIYTYT